MRILDRYVCREVFSHALLGLVVFTFVLFVPQLVRLMELLVRHSADAPTVAILVLCTLPGVLTFTVPMAVLVGVLIGLGRMSADSEIIALHALGIGLRRILLPVGVLALATSLLTLSMTLWIGPAALSKFRALEESLRATQASFEIQPRVFDERFPKLVLYVQDVEAAATRWRGLLLAESGTENGSRLTLADEAIVIADRAQGKFQLHLQNGSTHEYSAKEPARYSVTTFGQSDLPIAIAGSGALRPAKVAVGELSTADLLDVHDDRFLESQVEFHRRLALPVACLVFALAGVPMGARSRRGGRAVGFILTILLICGYYVLFVTGTGMARRGAVSPLAGLWAANVITAFIALMWLPRMEQVRREGVLTRWAETIAMWRGHGHSEKPVPKEAANSAPVRSNPRPATPSNSPAGSDQAAPQASMGKARGFPLLLDFYILRNFFSTLLLMLLGFVLLFHAFTFFELLNDIARNKIPAMVVARYFFFFTPYLLYQLLPLAALVAVLTTLGVMAKNNEITAFKASGTSLYRLALPLLVAGALLSGGMILLDDTYLPYANRQQDALRNRIKGRPAQTFYQPRRQWIFGQEGRLYNYELFDADANLFGGLSVFELDPENFQMRRRIYAARAHWEEKLGTWVLEDGWVRDFEGANLVRYTPFPVFTLAELKEPPAYFKREMKQSTQMTWRELRLYIGDLQQAGFDVARLSVQWHKKFAFPLLTPVIVLLGVPFAFLVGTRGALGGVAAAMGIGIAYWAISALFEALGAVGQLPPFLAAWAPDTIFAFLGVYFFLKMPT